MSIFSRSYPVTNSVMDSEFRLSAVGAASLFQDCFAVYMAQYKVAAFDLRDCGIMWVLNDYSLRFSGEQPFWGKTVRVDLWISERPTVKVHADFRISLDGKTVAEGDSAWALLGIESRQPLLTWGILPEFETDSTLALGTHRHIIPASTEEFLRHTHITNSSDTDFNHHISNLTDLRICFNAMPADYLSTHAIREFSIRFIHEAFVGKPMECCVHSTAEKDLFCYTISSNGQTISRACIRYTQKEEAQTVSEQGL